MISEKKCNLIYSVDDDPYTVHVWYQFEADGTFGNVSFGGSNKIEEALDHCQTCEEKTLYVLDSNMPISTKVFDGMSKLIREGLDINIDEFRSIEVLTGVFGAASLKLIRSGTKVILLTAFYKEIENQSSNPRIEKILKFGCDEILAKPCEEKNIIATIKKYVM